MLIACIIYVQLMLIGILGLILVGIRNERQRNKRLLMELWRRGVRRVRR